MLILHVKRGEFVMAGNMRVFVHSSSESGVRLGFDAPPDVIIKRQSLLTAEELKQLEGGGDG